MGFFKRIGTSQQICQLPRTEMEQEVMLRLESDCDYRRHATINHTGRINRFTTTNDGDNLIRSVGCLEVGVDLNSGRRRRLYLQCDMNEKII